MISGIRENGLRGLRPFAAHAFPLLVLFAITAATYGEVLTHKFLVTWDDQRYITQNPAIRGFSLKNLNIAFSHNYMGNYAPLHIMSYMFDFTLWGMNPFGYLLANITYHLLAGMLLYFLMIRQGVWKWGAVVGCSLFLVHPVQMESVAWLSQRKTLLAMVFYLAGFHAYLSYREQDGASAGTWYVVSLLAAILALLSKSVAVIFPLMLAMFDVLVPPVRRGWRSQADKLPYLALAGVVAILTIILQQADHGGGRAEYPPAAVIVLPLTMLTVLVSYLRLLLWPDLAWMSAIYDPPLRGNIDGEVLVGLTVAVCLLMFGVYLFRKSRPYFFWYALFFLGLLPVSQIIPLITIMNDRYLYFPLMGLAGLVGLACSTVREQVASRMLKNVALAVVVVVQVILAIICHERGRVWKDTITLFSDTTPKVTDRHEPWFMLADGYLAAGEYETARECIERGKKNGPLDESDYYYLGWIYLNRGEDDKARRYAEWLLGARPQRTIGLLLLGELYGRHGNYPEAKKQLTKYLDSSPHSAQGLFSLGQVYFLLKEYDLAREYYLKAVQAGDDGSGIMFAIACLESMVGRVDQSLNYVQRALDKGFDDLNALHTSEYLALVRKDSRFVYFAGRYKPEGLR